MHSHDENIGDVFVRMKHKFLVYAPFIVQCENLEKHIQFMRIDGTIEPGIVWVEDALQKSLNTSNDRAHPINFDQLLMLPFQHILR